MKRKAPSTLAGQVKQQMLGRVHEEDEDAQETQQSAEEISSDMPSNTDGSGDSEMEDCEPKAAFTLNARGTSLGGKPWLQQQKNPATKDKDASTNKENALPSAMLPRRGSLGAGSLGAISKLLSPRKFTQHSVSASGLASQGPIHSTARQPSTPSQSSLLAAPPATASAPVRASGGTGRSSSANGLKQAFKPMVPGSIGSAASVSTATTRARPGSMPAWNSSAAPSRGSNIVSSHASSDKPQAQLHSRCQQPQQRASSVGACPRAPSPASHLKARMLPLSYPPPSSCAPHALQTATAVAVSSGACQAHPRLLSTGHAASGVKQQPSLHGAQLAETGYALPRTQQAAPTAAATAAAAFRPAPHPRALMVPFTSKPPTGGGRSSSVGAHLTRGSAGAPPLGSGQMPRMGSAGGQMSRAPVTQQSQLEANCKAQEATRQPFKV